jgi:Flp pilus assembly protein TadD
MRHLGTARRILLGSAIMGLAACNGTGQSIHAQYPQAVQAQPGGILAIANDMAAKGDHSAAAPLYRQQATATGNPEAVVGLARSLSALGKYDEAENILQDLALRGSMSQEAWYLLGKSRIALGKFDSALIALDQAAALPPVDTRVNSARGISMAALGRVGEAIAAFQNSVDPASLGNLALVFAMTGNPEAAVNILEPLAASGQASAQGRQNLAMAYLLAGRESEARQMARLDLDPTSVDETFTFYRTLASLPVDKRMQALTTGVIAPDWTLEESGNLMLAENDTREAAAMRIAAKPILAEAKPAPVPVTTEQPAVAEAAPQPEKVDVANYELKELPPLVEPHGWALQIGAYRTEKALMRGWTILYRANADILGDIPPRRSEVDFGNREGKPKGFYYRLNAGPLKSLSHARELCRELLTRGTECWVRPPEKSEGRVTAPETGSDVSRDVSTASNEATAATDR